MKTRKGIAAVLAGVMALAALPFSALSAGAESAYAPGDVDMDGYITAHDAAVVSRALYVDETALNDEQKQLADVNGDGVVDQTDADWIYEHSEYKLGAVNQKEYMSSTTLFYQMYYIARKGAGYHDALLTDGSIPESAVYAIRAARANGNLMFINTGRCFQNVEQRFRDVGFDGFVCGCGTDIYCDGAEILHVAQTHETVMKLLLAAREWDLSLRHISEPTRP